MTKRMKPVMCDYCGAPAELVADSEVYAESYGSFVWRCVPCGAWVGVHRDSPRHKPLGRLANKELRPTKIQAHAHFDLLWLKAIRVRGWPRGKARRSAYRWLSKSMNVPYELCHIGMFDLEQCRRVVEVCKARRPIREEVTNG